MWCHIAGAGAHLAARTRPVPRNHISSSMTVWSFWKIFLYFYLQTILDTTFWPDCGSELVPAPLHRPPVILQNHRRASENPRLTCNVSDLLDRSLFTAKPNCQIPIVTFDHSGCRSITATSCIARLNVGTRASCAARKVLSRRKTQKPCWHLAR